MTHGLALCRSVKIEIQSVLVLRNITFPVHMQCVHKVPI